MKIRHINKRNSVMRVPSKQAGWTLIEVLIATVISLIAVAFILNIFINNIRATSENVSAARLDTELRSVMAQIVEETRRAGYWGGMVVEDGTSTTLVNPRCNPFSYVTGIDVTFIDEDGSGTFDLGEPKCDSVFDQGITNLAVSDDRSCITFTYDRNKDGSVDSNEFYGFRLINGAIQIGQSNDCDAADWGDNWLTDPQVITVGTLTFDTTNTICTDVNVADTASYYQLSGGDCINDYLTIPDAVISSTGHYIVQNRIIDISIEASLTADAAVTKSLRHLLNVRNHVVALMP